MLQVRELVRGPFCSPKLLRTIPVGMCSSNCQEKGPGTVKKPFIRNGIPDSWGEYLSVEGFGEVEDRCALQRELISSCVRCHVTDCLWNELGLSLAQGIPDPHKHCSDYQARPAGRFKRKDTCCAWKSSSQKIRRDVDHDDAKQDCGRSKVTMTNSDDSKKFAALARQVKKSLSETVPNLKGGDKKPKGELPCTTDRRGARRFESMLDVQGDLSRKSKGCDDSSAHAPILPRQSSMQTEKPACLEKAMTTDGIINTKTRNYTSLKAEETLLAPRICCNCAVPHYTILNISPEDIKRFRESNIPSQIVCGLCEGIRCSNNSRNLNAYDLTARVCKGKVASTSREELYKWTKQKLCHCLQKAKQKAVQQQTPVTWPPSEKRRKPCGDLKDLKLVCGRCSCPYLKITSITHAGVSHDRSSKQRKQYSDYKSNTSFTKLDKPLKSKPVFKSSENVSQIPDCYCLRRSNKTCADRVPHTKHAQCRNSKTNVLNEEHGNEGRKSGEKKATPLNIDRALASRDKTPVRNTDREKILESAYQGNRMRIDNAHGKKVKTNDISDSDTGDNVLKEVKHLQGARSDMALMYCESSSEDADISDTSGDVNIDANVPKSSVTSMTFVKRLDKNRKLIVNDYETRVSKSRPATRRQPTESRIKEAFPNEKPEDCCYKLSPPIEPNDSPIRRLSDHKANGNVSCKEKLDNFTDTGIKRNVPQEVEVESPVELINPNSEPYQGRKHTDNTKSSSPREAASAVTNAVATKNKGSPRDKTRSTNDLKRVQLRDSISKPITPRDSRNKATAGRNIRVPVSSVVRSTKKEKMPNSLRADYCQPSINPNARQRWFSPTRSCDGKAQQGSKYCDHRGYWCD